jgi:hypothetical protein
MAAPKAVGSDNAIAEAQESPGAGKLRRRSAGPGRTCLPSRRHSARGRDGCSTMLRPRLTIFGRHEHQLLRATWPAPPAAQTAGRAMGVALA